MEIKADITTINLCRHCLLFDIASCVAASLSGLGFYGRRFGCRCGKHCECRSKRHGGVQAHVATEDMESMLRDISGISGKYLIVRDEANWWVAVWVGGWWCGYCVCCMYVSAYLRGFVPEAGNAAEYGSCPARRIVDATTTS